MSTKRHSLVERQSRSPSTVSSPVSTPIRTPRKRLSLYGTPGQKANIQVCARFRPPLSDNSPIVAEFSDDTTVSIHSKDYSYAFTYDRVFHPDATQEQVYEYTGRATVSDLFDGYNSTVLAYGQSGSGKSYTMLGQNDGIIPRIINDIFDYINKSSSDMEYIVAAQFMEIYMEQVRDLIDRGNICTVAEDHNGVYVKGISHAYVSSATELLQVLTKGNDIRATGATGMNAGSSRSHAIFQISLSQRDGASFKKSNLFLVDLAGSEKVDRTGAQGQSLEEAKKINKSLSALGNVIYSLAEGKSSHIPFRDSKLTRILQESIGGNARTTLIVNCSPSQADESETLSSLRFGSSAKKIKNKPIINTELSVEAMKIKIDNLEKNLALKNDYIQELEHTLALNQSSNIHTFLHQSDKSSEISIRDQKIKELEQKILTLQMDALKTQHEEQTKFFQLEKLILSFSDKLDQLETTNNILTEDILASTKLVEQRNEKIAQLERVLKEQQIQVSKENINIENKLSILKEKLQKQSQNSPIIPCNRNSQNAPSSTISSNDLESKSPEIPEIPESSQSPPTSPKRGINLKIVKPMRGGQGQEQEQ